MKVLVTGATGFVGGHTAAALCRAGHDLRLLVRDEAKARRFAEAVGFAADDIVVGDITDRASVTGALSGCDAVLHAAAVVSLERRHAEEAMKVNAAGAEIVLRAATDAGVARIVYVSSTSALDMSIGEPLSVETPVSAGMGYAASKGAAERIARALQAEGAPLHITYPSGVLGPAAAGALGEASTEMARFVAAGFIPTPAGALSFVDVRDVAEVHVALVDGGGRPGRVMCGGNTVPSVELGAMLRELTGRRFPVLPVPPGAWRAAGRLADRVSARLDRELPLNEETMTIITTWPGTVDNMADVGVSARPFAETLADSLRAWVDAGLLTRRQAGRLAR